MGEFLPDQFEEFSHGNMGSNGPFVDGLEPIAIVGMGK